MARFDVYREASTYLLECQSDALDELETRFVVPLLPVGQVPKVSRLNPVFRVEGEALVMATHLAASVPARRLRNKVASLGSQHITIIDAFDMLLSGY